MFGHLNRHLVCESGSLRASQAMTDPFDRTWVLLVVAFNIEFGKVPRTVIERIAANRIRISFFIFIFFGIGELGVGYHRHFSLFFLTSASNVWLIAVQLGLGRPDVVVVCGCFFCRCVRGCINRK
jgi:hypothetical protein